MNCEFQPEPGRISSPHYRATASVCAIDCRNDSTCVEGDANFADLLPTSGETIGFLLKTNISGYHCDCPDGFTGLDCGRSYTTCKYDAPNSTIPVKCFHGGKCISGIDNISDSDALCDCSTATYEEKVVVGMHCDLVLVDSVRCGADATFFCMIGGACRADFASNPEGPCDCVNGYTGGSCIFPPDASTSTSDRAADDLTCDLHCEKGGTCNLGNYGPWGNSNGMYCQCDEGSAGIQCEYSAEVCGNGEHVCLNGAKCVDNGDGNFGCDCQQAHTNRTLFAGGSCQHHHTEICSPTRAIEYSDGMAIPAFCVNGGKCFEQVIDRKM
jgi:hypothetical protein